MAPSTTEGRPALGRHGDGDAGMGREVAERLAHLGRAGGAVEPDDVEVAWPRGRSGRRRSRCPAACGRSVSMVTWTWIGHVAAGGGHGPPSAVDGRLGLEQVEHGLDDEQVDAALEEGRRLLLVGIPQLGVADLAEGGELGPRARALPATQRGRSGVAKSSAACPGQAGAARLSSWARSARPYSASTVAKAPKVSVSTTSHPTSRNDRWTPVDHVGSGDHQELVAALRARGRRSRRPSGPASCRLVPMAPSKTTTRSRTARR